MKRRSAIALIVVVAVLLIAALALRWAMRPETLGPRVLAIAGQALQLDISADRFDYRLRGGPSLVARGVSARIPGVPQPMLEAERILVAVPWSTLRARGADPTVTRVELDAPQVALEPFLRWWSQRPRGDGPLPTLRDGLRVDRGRIDAGDWSLRDIAIDLPHFAPEARLAAGVRGRYQTATLQAPFNLQVAMTRPAMGAGIGAAGTVTPRADAWRLPSLLELSARLGADADATFRLQRLRLSSNSRYVSARTSQSFALGLAGEGAVADSTLSIRPAAMALRGRDMVPHLRARGRLDFGPPLGIELDGQIERWPDAWPALPSPVGNSDSPLTFTARYRGAANGSDPVELRLARDDAHFEGQLRITEVASWISDSADGSPLPPLNGSLTAPHVDIAGASLHGVEMIIEEDSADAGEDR